MAGSRNSRDVLRLVTLCIHPALSFSASASSSSTLGRVSSQSRERSLQFEIKTARKDLQFQIQMDEIGKRSWYARAQCVGRWRELRAAAEEESTEMRPSVEAERGSEAKG